MRWCCPPSRQSNASARDWTAFAAYTEAMTRSSTLTVTEQARAMAHRLLAGARARPRR
jgi:hypothetical protein